MNRLSHLISKSSIRPSFYQFCKQTNQQTLTLAEQKRMSMTPHQYYLAQGKGQERPFTGDLYFVNKQGNYHCQVCDHKVFSFEHKYFPESGHCSFWGNHKDSLKIEDDVDSTVKQYSHNVIKSEFKKGATDLTAQEQQENVQLYSQEKRRAECANCGSHLGLVFKDGPPPFFIRISANSESLVFKEKPVNPNPLEVKREKKRQQLIDQQREEMKRRQIDQKGKFNRDKYYEVHEK